MFFRFVAFRIFIMEINKKITIGIITLSLVVIILNLAIIWRVNSLINIPQSNATQNLSGDSIPVTVAQDYSKCGITATTTCPAVEIENEEIVNEATIIFGGDVMLSRQVNAQMKKRQSYTWPFEKIAETLATADLAVINLESPFSFRGQYDVPTGSFIFNADPKSVSGLSLAGVDLVSLANNHFGNMGTAGMQDTFEILSDNDIAFVGAGDNKAQARVGKIIERNGIKFGFLGYAYPNDSTVATEAKPGILTMDVFSMAEDVAEISTKADIVIILMHAGTEYVSKPNWQQVEFAHAAIEAGADLIIGHHPHWVQSIEIYQDKPIFYSLGNLVFDQMWSAETQQGALVKINFNKTNALSAELIPVRIVEYGQATLANLQDSETILSRMSVGSSTIEFIAQK
jgi:poly-gamma-glutamate synthesis protein (capsule biosynthesis protein)